MSDPVDALLRRAGAQWRSGLPPAPDVPPVLPGPDRRRWPAALATAAVVTAVIASVAALTARPDTSHPAGVVVVTSAAAAPDGEGTELVVRDGDEVEASGLVVAAPGEPVRFCAPSIVPMIGRPDGREPPPSCSFGVTVVGVDLDALVEAGTTADVRHGRAHLRGVWHAGVITVTEQGPPVADPPPAPAPPLPCADPDGGWTPGFSPNSNELHEYIEAHAEQFRPLWVSYPAGVPGGSMSPDTVEVLVVEVVHGDAEQASVDLRRHYAGNLCVVARPDLPSLADQRRMVSENETALQALMGDPANGIYTAGYADVIIVELVVLTETLLAEFTELLPATVEFQPWLRPAR
jgi:hypothetical protein